ncbi:MlaD family protein [Mesorhizobium sp. VNQ89]|uniref:MlaD family protein n=1 Tax=Mesorhizobium quangtriensis TaxID=3157709 RepID=UPI0032B824DF
METRANYVIVGIFTLIAIVSAFVFVYWASGIGDRGETTQLRIRIPGSASGLGRGSAVLFNGVKVGDIRRVYIDVLNPTVAIADAEVDRLTPITKSTQADVGIAGLTGQANIELRGAGPTEPNLLDEAEQNGTVAEITANPSAVTNLLQTAQDIFKRADNVLNDLETFTRDVRGPLTQTAKNVETFSKALADNSDGIDNFLSSVTAVAEELQGFAGKLDGTIKAAENLLNSVDPEKIKSIVANVEGFTADLKQQSARFDGIVTGIDQAVAQINGFAKQAEQTLTKVDGVIDGVNPETVRTTLDNIAKASASADKAASDIAAFTTKLSPRAADIDKVISDAREISGRLNAASTRVDGILAKVDSLLGSGDAQGVMAQAGETLKSFKQVADTLNARLGGIMDNLARFSGSGLQDVDALVQDARRSINRIERAVTDLERNPQRIITGGDGSVRQYDGRMRR